MLNLAAGSLRFVKRPTPDPRDATIKKPLGRSWTQGALRLYICVKPSAFLTSTCGASEARSVCFPHCPRPFM